MLLTFAHPKVDDDVNTNQGREYAVRIELHEANDAKALGGTPELWMRVLSDTLLDLPTAVKNLDPEQRKIFDEYHPTPVRYYPAGFYDEAGSDHHYVHEDWWIFRESED